MEAIKKVETLAKINYPIELLNLNAQKKEVNIGLIGLGRWGRHVLFPKLKSLRTIQSKAKYDRIYLHDNDSARSNIAEIDSRIKTIVSSNFYQIANHPAIDALVIATPDDTHYVLVKEALNAGKHVFVEKCFVRSTEQARELVKLAHDRDLQLMVGYEFMFDKRFIALKKLLDSGKLGKIEAVTTHLINKQEADSTVPWGDATLVEHHSCHQLSILQLLLGNHVPEDIQIHEAQENYVWASMCYRGVNVDFTTAIKYPSQQSYRDIKIKGSRFTVALDFSTDSVNFNVKFTQTNDEIDSQDPSYPEELCNLSKSDCVEDGLRYFYKLITDDVENVSGGKTAVHMLELTTLLSAHYQISYSRAVMMSTEKHGYFKNNFNLAIDHVFRDNPISPSDRESLNKLSPQVIEILRETPYILAHNICAKLDISCDQLRTIYKIIQCSSAAQTLLRAESNFDYFSVVDAFFNRNQYEATFFVGIVCPYKCTFCKMQMTALPVHDDTPRFEHRKSDLLNIDDINTTIRQLADLNRTGKSVTVKISGGLEPLTDMKRVTAIANSAFKHHLPLKLYTNGVLINSQAKRDLLLKFNDVRISLNTINEKKYREIYLDEADGNKSRTVLSKLIGLIERLVQDKNYYQSSTRIGFNFVVIRETIEDMEAMAYLASTIGLDYINYNIDYFDSFSDREFIAIKEHMKLLNQLSRTGKLDQLKVNFGGSLLKDNLFTKKPSGQFNPIDIRKHKVFIEPGGNMTPLHEGTFAFRQLNNKKENNPYTLGRLDDTCDFNMLLNDDVNIKDIGYDYLAPLELILASEMIRLKEDHKLGLEAHHSPYNTRYSDIAL